MIGRVSPQEALIQRLVSYSKPDAQPEIIPPADFSPVAMLSAQHLIEKSYAHIIQLRQIIDAEYHINSKLINVDGKKVWLRYGESGELNDDALSHQQNLQLNYLRLFYSYVIGAVTIGKMYQFENDPAFLNSVDEIQQSIFVDVQREITDGDEDSIKRVIERGKAELMRAIQNAAPATESFKTNDKDLSKKLDQVKDWAGLEDETYTVATIMKMEGASVDPRLVGRQLVLLDEPCTELTAAQIEELNDCDNQQWFKNLDPFQQRLVKNYIPKILSGKCVIPSQLRTIAPLCRNFYRQTPAVVEANGDVHAFSSAFHSGTDAYLSDEAHKENQPLDETAKHVTQNNFRQIKKNLDADVVIIFNLNSELADRVLGNLAKIKGESYRKDDSKILELSAAASEDLDEEGIYDAKVCANGFRRVIGERDNLQAVRTVIEIIESNLNTIGNAAEYQYQSGQIRLLISEIKYKLLGHSIKKFSDRDLEGFTIISKMNELCEQNTKLARSYNEQAGNNALKTTYCKFNCASGDNRTGIVELVCATDRYFDHFGTNASQKLGKEIALTVAKFEHIQMMKGGQGCTFGTEFIRSKSMGSLPHSLQYIKYYMTEAYGDLKNIFFKDKNKPDQEMRPVVEWSNANKVRAQIRSLGCKMNLSKSQQQHVKALKSELIKELEASELSGKQKRLKRYEISKVVNKTKALLTEYNAKVSTIKSEPDPTVKKREFESFVSHAKAYENDAIKLSTNNKKIGLLCFTLVGALIGAVLGAVICGGAGLAIGGHVGVGIGAVFGLLKGAKLGMVAGAAAASALSTFCVGKITHSGSRSLFFKPSQVISRDLSKDLTGEIKEAYTQKRTH